MKSISHNLRILGTKNCKQKLLSEMVNAKARFEESTQIAVLNISYAHNHI